MKLTAYPTLSAACDHPRRIKISHLLSLFLFLCIAGCASHPRYHARPPFIFYQIGYASYYAHKFHGRPTASGEIFDMNGLSAAHRELPLGTVIRVTHLKNGKSIIIPVNDRGPFIEGRILDLSLGAAKKLDMVNEGVAKVKIEIAKSIN